MSPILRKSPRHWSLWGYMRLGLVTTPVPSRLRALRLLRAIFFEETDGSAEIIAKLIPFSVEAPKDGIVSLERSAASLSGPFLRKAMSPAVDGADLEDLRSMMEVDIAAPMPKPRPEFGRQRAATRPQSALSARCPGLSG